MRLFAKEDDCRLYGIVCDDDQTPFAQGRSRGVMCLSIYQALLPLPRQMWGLCVFCQKYTSHQYGSCNFTYLYVCCIDLNFVTGPVKCEPCEHNALKYISLISLVLNEISHFYKLQKKVHYIMHCSKHFVVGLA